MDFLPRNLVYQMGDDLAETNQMMLEVLASMPDLNSSLGMIGS